MKTIFDTIVGQPFFRGWSQEHLRTLADIAMQTWFEADELIFHDDDLANRFYLIVEGEVALESSEQNGEAVVLQTIGSGELLGWSCMFSPYVWRLNARAVQPTEAIFFYGTRLREQCEQDHDFGFKLMKRMTQVVIHRLQAARTQLLSIRH